MAHSAAATSARSRSSRPGRLENPASSIGGLSSSNARGKRRLSPDPDAPHRAVKRSADAGEVVKQEPEEISLSELSAENLPAKSSAKMKESVIHSGISDSDGESVKTVKRESEDLSIVPEYTSSSTASIQSIKPAVLANKSEVYDPEQNLQTSQHAPSALLCLHPIFLQDIEPDAKDGTRCICRGMIFPDADIYNCQCCFRRYHWQCVPLETVQDDSGQEVRMCPLCALREDRTMLYSNRIHVTYHDHLQAVDLPAMIRMNSEEIIYGEPACPSPNTISVTLVCIELEDRETLRTLIRLQCAFHHRSHPYMAYWSLLEETTKIITGSYYDRFQEESKQPVLPLADLEEIAQLCEKTLLSKRAFVVYHHQLQDLLISVANQMGIKSLLVENIKTSHEYMVIQIQTILMDDSAWVHSLQGVEACQLLNILQELIDAAGYPDIQTLMWGNIETDHFISAAKHMIIMLSTKSGQLPSSLFLKRIVTTEGRSPIGTGAHADVYGGEYEGEQVVLKRLRIFAGAALSNHHKNLCREALSWCQLRHSNIVPFLGLDCDTYAPFPCMVSPLMSGGTLLDYLGQNETPFNMLPYISDIVEGLHYLHSQNFIHGDLRAANVFVNEKGRACISDFGLISFIESIDQNSTMGGNPRWMAPELQSTDNAHRTFASDVYSFGCLCLETITREPPFAEIKIPARVCMKVVAGERPSRPPSSTFPTDIHPDSLWTLIETSWAQEPRSRPPISEIRDWLKLARQL